jgi:class 3 adenylate cyclase
MSGQPTSMSHLGDARTPTALPVRGEGRAVAVSVFGLVTGLYAAGVVLTFLGEGQASTVSDWGSAGWIGLFLVPVATYAFPVVGALIVLRRPRNLIGWLCFAIGTSWGAVAVVDAYALYGLASHRGPLPGFEIALALKTVGWIPGIGLMIFLILVFPDGRLPSHRWRAVAALTALTLVVVTFAILFGTENFADSGFPQVGNPLRIESIGPVLAQAQLGVALLPVWMLAAVLSIAVRYRKATGIERLQLKWLVAAGVAVVLASVVALVSAGLVVSSGGSGGVLSLVAEVAQDVSVLSLALLPIAIGIAMLRHHLYDIDLFVNRTLVYGGATVILAAAFGAANVLSQRVLEVMSGGRSDLVTGVLAVGAALAFAPTRRRIRPIVDRFLPARARLALLFTDIVGSTRIAAEIGDERWRSLLDRYRATFRREIARFGGREINTAGDSFFATFERPAGALRCAWAGRDAVRGVGLETRTGVHVGECEMRGETVSGLAVHTAARVMATAGDGEVYVSDALREAVAELDVVLAERGLHVLKGVPGEWRLYRVDALGAP